MNQRVLAGGLVLAALILGGSVRAADEKADKPADAFNAFFAAMKKGDFKAGYKTLTPESGDRLVGDIVATVWFLRQLATPGKASEKFKPIDALLASHGLKGEQFEKDAREVMEARKEPKKAGALAIKLVAPVKDRVKLLTELVDLLDKLSGGKMKTGPSEAKLTAVKIDKDTATGTATYKVGDREKKETFTFKKIKGSWKVELPEKFGLR